jgi:LEA14-like dessication related protein
MAVVKQLTGLILVFFILASCGKPQAPEYAGYENFRLEKAGLSGNILAADVKLFNPNNYNLQLKSASMDVYFNDRFLGHSSLDTLIILTAKDTTSFPLRMQASVKDLLKNAASLLLNPNVKLRITGSAKAGRGGFFINVPVNYEGMQKIELLGSN